MVGDQVAGDGDQPCPEVAALPGERLDPAQRAQERLTGEVLGELAGAHAVVDVAVDRVDVAVVELRERLGVAAPGPVDERRDAPRLGIVEFGRGRRRGDAVDAARDAARDAAGGGGAGRHAQRDVRRGLRRRPAVPPGRGRQRAVGQPAGDREGGRRQEGVAQACEA